MAYNLKEYGGRCNDNQHCYFEVETIADLETIKTDYPDAPMGSKALVYKDENGHAAVYVRKSNGEYEPLI